MIASAQRAAWKNRGAVACGTRLVGSYPSPANHILLWSPRDGHWAAPQYNLSDLLDEQGRSEAAIDCLHKALNGDNGLEPRIYAVPYS